MGQDMLLSYSSHPLQEGKWMFQWDRGLMMLNIPVLSVKGKGAHPHLSAVFLSFRQTGQKGEEG